MKKKLLAGLIFDPIKNEIFYAEKNNGSFLIIAELEFRINQILKIAYLHQIMKELN